MGKKIEGGYAKVMIIISNVLMEEIRKRHPENISKGLRTVLEDYFTVEKLVLRELKGYFTQNELQFIADALNGLIFTPLFPASEVLKDELEKSEIYEKKAQKWNVNLNELFEKIDNLSESQIYVFMRAVEDAWKKGKINEFVQSLAENKEGLVM